MNKKILIPVDFSEYSIRACEIGFEYAGRSGAEVMLFHAYYKVFMKEEFNHFIQILTNKVSFGEIPAVKYDYTIREGVPDDEIIAYLKEYQPTLVFMGTRGKSRKNIDLIGSVTAEIIERTKAPLLAVPEDISFQTLKEAENIAFAVSFHEQELLAPFNHFLELIADYSPKIHLFNISASKNEWDEIRMVGVYELMKKHHPNMDIDFTLLNAGDRLNAIEQFVREKRIDVITLTTYRRNIITQIFNPSIARRMLFHANTALLVIPQ